MSRDGAIELTFLDGEDYVFRLAWGQLIKLQEVRLCGAFLVFERLHGSEWMVEDIREVIRLGLVGGGLDPIKATKLVKEYVEQRPPIDRHKRAGLNPGDPPVDPLGFAIAIIAAGITGPPDEEPLEKKAAAPIGSTTSTMDASASAHSTGQVH